MRLVLVRHAAPTVRRDIPSHDWHLSPEGRIATEMLAEDPLWREIEVIYTSPEPKATRTAQGIAAHNGLPIRIEADLREAERPWSESYRDVAARYLGGEKIDGWEARDDAQRRVHDAVERIAGERDTAIVSHGLVLTLLVEDAVRLAKKEAVDSWAKMRFPDVAVLDLSTTRLERSFGQPGPIA